MSEPPAQVIPRLAQWLRESHYTTVFTGAGMSTESGLPDFRSSGGLWRQSRRFEELASVEAMHDEYDEFLAFYRWRVETLLKHQPHEGHRLIAKWQQQGRVQALITQNVDGFHQAAGSPAPIQLHGNLREFRCLGCGLEAPAEQIVEPGGERCRACGGRLRPNVVLFGEMLPADALDAALAASRRSDLFIVLGSSLLVSPANFFPQMAKQAGAKLVIVNRGETPLDDMADLTIDAAIGPTLAAVDAAL